jgi:hypothetical protein
MGGLAVYFGSVGLLAPVLFKILPPTLGFSPFVFKLANNTLSSLPYANFIKAFSPSAFIVNLGGFAFAVLFGLSLLLADDTFGPKDELTAQADGDPSFPAVPDGDEPIDMGELEITMIGLGIRDELDEAIGKLETGELKDK